MTQKKRKKLTPAFSPKPLTIANIMGSMITASDGEYQITQNDSPFRNVENHETVEVEDSSEVEGNEPDSHKASLSKPSRIQQVVSCR